MATADDIRPRGHVEVLCAVCEWWFWVDCLDARLPAGPFTCEPCALGPDARAHVWVCACGWQWLRWLLPGQTAETTCARCGGAGVELAAAAGGGA
jgi:hypothetical protein